MSPDGQQELPVEGNNRGAFASAFAKRSDGSEHSVLAFKFGGSSLLGAERMLHAAGIVREAASCANVVVVVSAMKRVTDRLLAIARTVEAGCRTDARRDAEHVFQLHMEVLRDLHLESQEHDRVARELQLLGQDLLHDASPETQPCYAGRAPLQDRLASYGERFSARLFAAALEKTGVPAVPVSSSEFVLTCDTFRDARPQIDETRRRGREILLPLFDDGLVPVVTGFISSTPDCRVTTLGRNTSDFSGPRNAHVFDADELTICTHEAGIHLRHPQESPNAKLQQ